MPSPPPSGITVAREPDFLLPGQSDWVLAESYASLRTDELVRALNRGDACVQLRSTDGGKTWGDEQLVAQPESIAPGRVRAVRVATYYLDPDNGLLVRFLSDIINSTEGGFAYGDAVGFGPHTGRILYQISRDAGVTWGAPQQLIETGARYDSEHWARDVWYGRSSAGVEGQQVVKLGNGMIVAPVYMWPSGRYMERIFEAQQWPPELRGDARYFLEARCLLLRWKPDLSGFTMESSSPIRLEGGYTHAGTCGSDEPAVAYLNDQRWFAIVRTSTSHVDTFRERGIPLLRQCAITTDAGKTWKADCLRFDDGGTVFSPSAWSQFVRSSRTGKWYWIGNILDVPASGNCDPRYPLQIVELDPKTCRLKRATVTVIQDREPGDDSWIRFSNFRVYEERASRDIVVLMRTSYCEFAAPGLPTPAYRYRIRIG